jgi:hypothetical protein
MGLVLTTAGISPDEWQFALRIYCDIGVQPRKAQQDLDAVMLAVEDRVDSHFGPSSWVVGPHPDNGAVLVAEWIVQCGRED